MPFVSGALQKSYYKIINVDERDYQISSTPNLTPERIVLTQAPYQIASSFFISPEKITFSQGAYQISFSPYIQPEKLNFTQGLYNIKTSFSFNVAKPPKAIDFRP